VWIYNFEISKYTQKPQNYETYNLKVRFLCIRIDARATRCDWNLAAQVQLYFFFFLCKRFLLSRWTNASGNTRRRPLEKQSRCKSRTIRESEAWWKCRNIQFDIYFTLSQLYLKNSLNLVSSYHRCFYIRTLKNSSVLLALNISWTFFFHLAINILWCLVLRLLLIK
jgi:hypothetical protein